MHMDQTISFSCNVKYKCKQMTDFFSEQAERKYFSFYTFTGGQNCLIQKLKKQCHEIKEFTLVIHLYYRSDLL